MKHGRHLWACLIALVLALACFAGCGEAAGGEEGTTPPDDTPSATPVRLELSGMKTAFEFGEEFSTGELVVTIRYSNGTKKTAAPSEYKVISSAYNAQAAGTYEILVRSGALSETYSVTVGEKAADWRDDGVLKILMIGNSFSDDASWHMPVMAEAAGASFYFGNVYYSGCSIEWHYDWLQNDRPNYEYRTYGSGDLSWTTHGNHLLRDAITETNWDFITFQAGSAGGNPTTSAHSYRNLGNFYNLVKSLANEEAEIVWHMTWADQWDSPRDEFNSLGKDQMKMYHGIVEMVQTQVLAVEGIERVIPSGTAVQNARSSYLGDTLTRDGYHLSALLGRYLAGLTVFCKLSGIAPEEIPHPDFLTEKECSVVWESVINALATPFDVTPSQYTT